MEQPCSSLVLLLSWGEQVVPSQLLCCASGWSCLISDASLASPVQWLLSKFCLSWTLWISCRTEVFSRVCAELGATGDDLRITGWSTGVASEFLIFAPGLTYDFSKCSDGFTPFFDFERPLLSPWAKLKNLRQGFGARNMTNKCEKFHGNTQIVQAVKS